MRVALAHLYDRAYSLYMATATIRTETTETVSLQLTLTEAEALRTALAHVGFDATHPIFAALGNAGVEWDENQVFRPTRTHGCIIAIDRDHPDHPHH